MAGITHSDFNGKMRRAARARRGRSRSRTRAGRVTDARLRIGVDARELVGRPTGVGRYLAGILGAWAADGAFPHHVTLFLPSPLPASLTGPLGVFDRHVDSATHAGTWWEQMRLPRAAAAAGVDVFFAAGYTSPIFLTCPSVVAI